MAEAEEEPVLAGFLSGNALMEVCDGTRPGELNANVSHTVTYDKKTEIVKIDSHLMTIDERIPSKPEVKTIVDKWNRVLENKIKLVVANPYEVIYTAEIPLDATDSASRDIQTNLGEIITRAMAESFNTEVEGALVNGGSFRLDDMLAGDVISLDIFRVLPFGGNVVQVGMKGSLLKEVLAYGKSKRGTGAYLQRCNITENAQGEWLLNFMMIENENVYKIAVSDFLLKGYDIPFLTLENEGIVSVHQPTEDEAATDIRKAVILYMKSLNE